MVYSDGDMPSESSEAPSVPSARGPLPAGLSPRWRRSAQGLRWMRFAIYVGVAAYAGGALASLAVGRSSPPGSIAVPLLGALFLLVYVAYPAALWRFGSGLTSTPAARPARQSFVCFASAVTSYCLGLLFAWLIPALSANSYRLNDSAFLLLLVFMPIALHVASLGLLVRALGAALRSLDETPPAWAPKAVGALLACWVFPIAIPGVTGRLPLGAEKLLWGLTLAGWGAFFLALASVMGRTARALDRRACPETAQR
ncbi:MAG: hypothetical protein Q8S73_21020 [Deltaproteobacteria bacterium]|nr:hypothetical protein [Deltaproteobacteria bacterium]